jgi:hypothetical protein
MVLTNVAPGGGMRRPLLHKEVLELLMYNMIRKGTFESTRLNGRFIHVGLGLPGLGKYRRKTGE